MKNLRVLFYLIIFCFTLLCGCSKNESANIPISSAKYEIENKNLMNQVDEQINFNGKQTNISIFEYESYEREIKVGDLSIKFPARFIGFLYNKIVLNDIDNDNSQEILINFLSSGSSGCQGLIIIKVVGKNIFEIPLPMYNSYGEDQLGVNADLSFTSDYEATITITDYPKTFKVKLDTLDEYLKNELYINGKINKDISSEIDPAYIIELEKDAKGKNVIKFYQNVWVHVSVGRICDLVSVVEIDNNSYKIVDIYISE